MKRYLEKKKKTTRAWGLLDISLIVFFLCPQNTILYLAVPALVYFCCSYRKTTKVQNITIFIIGLLLLSALINISNEWVSLKNYFRAIEFLILFASIGRLNRYTVSKYTLMIIMAYLLIFQFAVIINNPLLNSFLFSVYPMDDDVLANFEYMQGNADSIGGYSFRLGSIYYSSNILAIQLCLLLCFVLIEKKQFKKIEIILLMVAMFGSLLVAGSRTGLIVFSMMFFFGGFSNRNINSKIVFFLLLLIVVIAQSALFGDYRAFQIRQGFSDSLSIKYQLFADYLDSIDTFYYFCGCFSSDVTKVLLKSGFAGCDFDIGNIIVSYGFLFLASLLFFFFKVCKYFRKEYYFVFYVLLWCFSNTIFMNYRGVACFLVIISVCLQRSAASNDYRRIEKKRI